MLKREDRAYIRTLTAVCLWHHLDAAAAAARRKAEHAKGRKRADHLATAEELRKLAEQCRPAEVSACAMLAPPHRSMQ